jgi:hypothetical protein
MMILHSHRKALRSKSNVTRRLYVVPGRAVLQNIYYTRLSDSTAYLLLCVGHLSYDDDTTKPYFHLTTKYAEKVGTLQIAKLLQKY